MFEGRVLGPGPKVIKKQHASIAALYHAKTYLGQSLKNPTKSKQHVFGCYTRVKSGGL